MRVSALTAVSSDTDEVRRNIEAGNPALNLVASGVNRDCHRQSHAMRPSRRRGIDVHDVGRKGPLHLEWK